MISFTSILKNTGKSKDVIIGIVLILAVFMMILPLPTIVVDILIALNLVLSLILLMMAVYIHEPVEFSTFPSVLLITTLYRLSLTISTSRLILLQHDAGDIVYTFGNFVVAGNLAVGIIIFSIITIVQFLVITKGAERVAEVSARFSLDGMPGKQMSIDGDMRAGNIDATEANHLRRLVQKESQLYGAMDGAMKFIKGDAIASMIVIIVNILGGMAVGVLHEGMSASEALNTYSVLSVGDGLVSQIPSLLISITAGIIVTRVPDRQKATSLAGDLFQQLGQHPRSLFIVAVVMFLFSLLPGFPTFVFLSMALILGGIAWALREFGTMGHIKQDQDISALSPGVAPLSIFVPPEKLSPSLSEALAGIRRIFFDELGILLNQTVKVKPHSDASGPEMEVHLYQEMVAAFTIPATHPWVIKTSSGLHPSQYSAVELWLTPDVRVYCVDDQHITSFNESGGTAYTSEEALTYCFLRVVMRYAKEFIGIQETSFLMRGMEKQYAELIRETQRAVPASKITDVLQRLLDEGVSVRDLRTIFEALIVWTPREKDIVILTEYVRIALRRHILNRCKNKNGSIDAWLIGTTIENKVREAIRQTSAGPYLALDSVQTEAILHQIRDTIGTQAAGVLVTSMDIRRFIRKTIEPHWYDIQVLSFQELGDDSKVNIAGNIELTG